MVKRIQIKILPNGQIEAITQGIKGKTCLDYVKRFEELLDAQITDSNFTSEYDEVEQSVVQTYIQTDLEQTLDRNFE
ncbi:MAG: DUF2997 domain-containing protein [Xenococcaceae cyanobacterium]